MTNLKHTPGPWQRANRESISTAYLYGPNSKRFIATVYNSPCDPDEQEANAHLIAAAPEMLEALETLEMKLDCLSGDIFRTKADKDFVIGLRMITKEAINKAQGKAV